MIKAVLCATLVTLSTAVAGEQQDDFLMLNYDIFSEGKDVGDMTLKLSKDEEGYIIIEQSHIKASGWWWNLDVTTVLSEEFRQDGVFIRGDGKTVVDGSGHWTRIDAVEDEYRAEYTEIVKTSKAEERQFSTLSFAVAKRVSPNIEEILARSKSIFSDRNIQPHGVKFPKDAFDTTWNNLPFFIRDQGKKDLPSKLRILDSENLEVVQVSLNDLGVEALIVDGRSVHVRSLKIYDGKFDPTYLWINEGRKGGLTRIPHFVRYKGKDEDGEFEIVLKSY